MIRYFRLFKIKLFLFHFIYPVWEGSNTSSLLSSTVYKALNSWGLGMKSWVVENVVTLCSVDQKSSLKVIKSILKKVFSIRKALVFLTGQNKLKVLVMKYWLLPVLWQWQCLDSVNKAAAQGSDSPILKQECHSHRSGTH